MNVRITRWAIGLTAVSLVLSIPGVSLAQRGGHNPREGHAQRAERVTPRVVDPYYPFSPERRLEIYNILVSRGAQPTVFPLLPLLPLSPQLRLELYYELLRLAELQRQQ